MHEGTHTNAASLLLPDEEAVTSLRHFHGRHLAIGLRRPSNELDGQQPGQHTPDKHGPVTQAPLAPEGTLVRTTHWQCCRLASGHFVK